MGIFDGRTGKKEKSDEMILEPHEGGYKRKGGHGSRISRVCVYFDQATPLEDERELLRSIIKESGLSNDIAPGALISTKYDAVPGINEYIARGEMPESLNAYVMAQAMLEGLARGQADMAKLAVNPVNYRGHKGVLVYKEA